MLLDHVGAFVLLHSCLLEARVQYRSDVDSIVEVFEWFGKHYER